MGVRAEEETRSQVSFEVDDIVGRRNRDRNEFAWILLRTWMRDRNEYVSLEIRSFDGSVSHLLFQLLVDGFKDGGTQVSDCIFYRDSVDIISSGGPRRRATVELMSSGTTTPLIAKT
jgi:hypothetical protein